MCLSTVYLRSDGQEVKIMKDVARMESDNGGFILTGLLGEQKRIQGQIKIVDFVDEHFTVIE
jgi:predicted RNA-binding protein